MRAPALVVEAVRPGCLIQDDGRPGLAHLGVGPSGAADRTAHALGNRILGNPAGAASVEIVLGGLALVATRGVWACLTGAVADLRVDGRARPFAAPVWLAAGARLVVDQPRRGLRSYLAVRGGIAVDGVLGSRATDTLGGLGPRPVGPGEILPVGAPVGAVLWDGVPAAVGQVVEVGAPLVLRVRRGPHDDRVADPEVLVTAAWAVDGDSDRIGTRLTPVTGPGLGLVAGRGELPSEGVVRGTIQVPPSGRPVVLGADHPVTGGYPVVGVVLDDDVDRLAQVRPGEAVRFVWA